jgi:eukaryotic-like serine/threonine-protein kinase
LGLLFSLWSQTRQVAKGAKRATQIELQLAQVEAERLQVREQLERLQAEERARQVAQERERDARSAVEQALTQKGRIEALTGSANADAELRAALVRARQAEAAAQKARAEAERARDLAQRLLELERRRTKARGISSEAIR